VLFDTYPWAFVAPGGGERQLLEYAKNLPGHCVEVVLHDHWNPALDAVDAVHFFSCIGGSWHFCNYVRERSLPLVISTPLWIEEETKHLYPSEEIRSQLLLADVIVTNSNAESEALATVFGLPRDLFVAVMNGLDPRFAGPHDSTLFPTRPTFGRAPREPRHPLEGSCPRIRDGFDIRQTALAILGASCRNCQIRRGERTRAGIGKKHFHSELHFASRFPDKFPLRDRLREHAKCFAMNRYNLFFSDFEPASLDAIWRRLRLIRPHLVHGHPSTMYQLALHIHGRRRNGAATFLHNAAFGIKHSTLHRMRIARRSLPPVPARS
jgi:hypothetical protein